MSRARLVLVSLVSALALSGCVQKMADQPSYRPLDPSAFFSGGQSARNPVTDTVPRGLVRDDPALFTGKVNGADVDTFPFPVTHEVLDRGQNRFNIYCAPCHDRAGTGDGQVVRRGFTHPPTFHQDRLRSAPVGHFFDVMTNGFGAMPSYADQVPIRDRWAIAAYIRALQLSQNATLADVPAEDRSQLQEAP